MNYKIALTGSTGNMGVETLRQLMELENVEIIKVLIRKESLWKAKKLKRKYKNKIEASKRPPGLFLKSSTRPFTFSFPISFSTLLNSFIIFTYVGVVKLEIRI